MKKEDRFGPEKTRIRSVPSGRAMPTSEEGVLPLVNPLAGRVISLRSFKDPHHASILEHDQAIRILKTL